MRKRSSDLCSDGRQLAFSARMVSQPAGAAAAGSGAPSCTWLSPPLSSSASWLPAAAPACTGGRRCSCQAEHTPSGAEWSPLTMWKLASDGSSTGLHIHFAIFRNLSVDTEACVHPSAQGRTPSAVLVCWTSFHELAVNNERLHDRKTRAKKKNRSLCPREARELWAPGSRPDREAPDFPRVHGAAA